MRYLPIAVGLLVGLISLDQCRAINVHGSAKTGNRVTTKKNGKKMISVGLTQTEYENSRYDDYMKPLSSESNLALA